MQYQKDFLKSRKMTKHDYFFCEIPWCWCVAVDIHHINQSMRGKRKNKDDGSDLIALCRKHHQWIHANDTMENREKLLQVVEKQIERINKFKGF